MNSNKEMIEYLKRNHAIESSKIEKVMDLIDRKYFISKGNPYEDSPQYIGYGGTISAPHMHAYALELLKSHLKPGNRVLDIGSGSGFLTACFANLVRPNGKVIGVDHIPELIQLSESNVRKHHSELLDSGILEFVIGDGRSGLQRAGPYHAIHVGAAAKTVPNELVDQLAHGGRLVIPVGMTANKQQLEQIDCLADGTIIRKELMPVRFVPLTDKECQWIDT